MPKQPSFERLPKEEMTPLQRSIVERQLSISKLARQAGMTQPYLWRLVHGYYEPKRSTAERLGALLGLDPADVMWPCGRGVRHETQKED